MKFIAYQEQDFAHIAKHILQTISDLCLGNTLNINNTYIDLEGNLGAGKTTLVRYILQELGFHGRVKSPTYNFLESYDIQGFHNYSNLQHFDLYRFTHEQMWLENGFDEYLNSNNLVFIEWSNLASNLLPKPIIKVQIIIDENDNRVITCNT
ncbi:MAG: hypothetical protein RLZZ210_1644 [Pseudomonadota bacterium]